MPVQSIRGVVEAAIQRASNATGVDFSFLMGTARRESGFNPGAKASTSSAAGLFQFVDQTWLSTLKQHGAKYGYARYADLISRGADGRYHVDGAEARQAVMALKLDPHAASLMAGELAVDHAAYLRGRVGREPTSGELYLAHVMGPKGSARLIDTVRTAPGSNAAALFPDAASANHAIFYRGGRAATVSEVYANLTQSAGGGGGTVRTPPPANTPDQGFVEYASARREAVLQQDKAMVDLLLRGPQTSDDAGAGMKLTGSMFTADMLRAYARADDELKRS